MKQKNILPSLSNILKALELYREMTLTDPEPIHTCSPHKLRKLVYTILSESQAIDLDFKPLKSESEKVKEIKRNLEKHHIC